MNNFDYIILVIIAVFTLGGFALGFIQAIGSLIGIFIASYISGIYFQEFAKLLHSVTSNEGLANILAFIILFILINKLVGLFFYFLNKIFGLITLLPFLSTFNRLLGAVLGFVEGVLAISAILYIASRFPVSEQLTSLLVNSKIASQLVRVASII